MRGRPVKVFGIVQHDGRILAPISTVTSLRFDSTAQRRNRRPVAVDPAKDTASRSMCGPMGSPTSAPLHGRTFSTPAPIGSSAMRSVGTGVSLAGFTITEQPAANAGSIFRASISRGKFQGSTRPTTPTGSRTIIAMWLSDAGAT
jgi:hypothetical protein